MLDLRAILTVLIVGTIVLLHGCASTTPYNTATSVTMPRVGTMIKLNQELAARGGVRIFLQNGYQKRFSEVAKLEPYCQFYVNRSSDELNQSLTIEPDTFIVQRVYRRKESVSTEALQVASEGESDMDHGSSQRTMSTFMELISDNQPEVTRLICSRWADPNSIYHVSIDEIVQSLGDVAEFIPPSGDS